MKPSRADKSFHLIKICVTKKGSPTAWDVKRDCTSTFYVFDDSRHSPWRNLFDGETLHVHAKKSLIESIIISRVQFMMLKKRKLKMLLWAKLVQCTSDGAKRWWFSTQLNLWSILRWKLRFDATRKTNDNIWMLTAHVLTFGPQVVKQFFASSSHRSAINHYPSNTHPITSQPKRYPTIANGVLLKTFQAFIVIRGR